MARTFARWRALLIAVAVAASGTASAEEIEISNYGTSPGGFPYAVALAKGYFREAGADVTGIRGSPGSAPTIRNLLAGGLAFADAGITGVIAANRSGADIRVIGNSTNTYAEVTWVTMPNSPVTSIRDLRGRRVGFTTPQSATNMLAVMLVDAAGLHVNDVQLIAAGGFPQAATALEAGALDVAPIVEPNFSMTGSRYRVLVRANDAFPAMSNTLLITTTRMARERGDFLRAILAARRRAVEFMTANPAEAGAIVAEAYRIEPALAERVIRNILENGSIGGVPYWSLGDINVPVIQSMIRGALIVGMINETYDVSQIIDDSFLPADLRGRR
jgi:NitT/TauT family transport system substrate-binding protein